MRDLAPALVCLLLVLPASAHGKDEQPHPALDAFRTAIETALASGQPDVALGVVETVRAPALHTALAAGTALRAHQVPAALRQAEADARTALMRARAALDSARRQRNFKAVRQARAALQQAQAILRERIERSLRAAQEAVQPDRPDPVRAEALRAVLAADEAFVHYVLHPGRAWALVTTRAQTRVVDLGGAAGLGEALDALQPSHREAPADAGLEMTRLLLVAPLALAERVRRVWVVPDGRLHAAPLALLFGDRDVVRLPSASIWMQLRASAPLTRARRVLGVGDPDYRRTLGMVPLPATRKEVDAVADVRLVAAEATVTTLERALAREPRWRAVHLACHARIDTESGWWSQLVLAPDEAHDGRLSALEILRMQVPCDLVVLSTQQSLRGSVDGVEGLEGLAPAFLRAGVRAVLGSLWNVDDEATAALMIRFHELWRPKQGEGLPAPEALRLAREHVRLQPRWAHPYYWAGWELYGAP